MKTKVSKVSVSIIRITLICSVVIVGIFLAGRQPEVKKFFNKIITSSMANTIWVLELEKRYTLCGHTDSEQKEYHSEKLLDEEILKLPDFHLKKAIGRRKVYINEFSDFCRSCQENRFLGISDNKVVAFRGTPERPGPVQEEIAIELKDLPKLELEDLKKGIPFKDNKEKLQLIEGLNGLSAN